MPQHTNNLANILLNLHDCLVQFVGHNRLHAHIICIISTFCVILDSTNAIKTSMIGACLLNLPDCLVQFVGHNRLHAHIICIISTLCVILDSTNAIKTSMKQNSIINHIFVFLDTLDINIAIHAVNLKYTKDLKDPISDKYKSYQGLICGAVVSLYSESVLKEDLTNCRILNFR